VTALDDFSDCSADDFVARTELDRLALGALARIPIQPDGEWITTRLLHDLVERENEIRGARISDTGINDLRAGPASVIPRSGRCS
jgi:hypothetical protein